MENLEARERLICVDFIEPEDLLFQIGYLNVNEWRQEPEGIRYVLTFPNKESRISFSSYLLYFILRSKDF